MNRYTDLLHSIQDEITKIQSEYDSDKSMMEYKQDFFNMSVGSLRAVMNHAKNILDSIDNPNVKENLTESWLQGKIAITEDYMRTIHDFVMYVSDAADTTSKKGGPGLWENIRKKKEKEGKKYKPAKPGDPDRPDPKQWKRLTKSLETCAKCDNKISACSCGGSH
jgi:hypothetical protein